MSQRQELWSYLNVHGSITRWQAFRDLGVAELSSRIGEIERERGVKIPRKRIEVMARNGRMCRVTEYGRPV